MGPVFSLADEPRIRCAPRRVPEVVTLQQIVMERVTECAPIHTLRIDPGPEPDFRDVLEREPVSQQEAKAIAAAEAKSLAARRASWSTTRDRLSNAQHESSVRDLRTSIRRRSR